MNSASSAPRLAFSEMMMTVKDHPVHVPVMPREVLQWLQMTAGLIVLDGTVGAGGHSSMIVPLLGENGQLIGLDRDPMMLALAAKALQQASCPLVVANYADSRQVLDQLGIACVDRVLLDLGLSSDQLADRNRGFGFDAGGALDMRFNPREGQSAADLLRSLSQDQLAEIFRTYGEESKAPQIAGEIIRRRNLGQPIRTTEQLEACVRAVTGAARQAGVRHPATKVFQALRIAANDELQHLQRMLTDVLPTILQPDGIVVIISFHSLEDRLIKNAFKGHHGWQVLTKTPVEAAPAEVRINPRSRSAKLRAARWLGIQQTHQ